MIRDTLTACLLGTTLACTAALAASGDMTVPDFGELDADGDGAMSEAEWMDSPAASAMDSGTAAAHYRMYDVDEDGSVSADEYAEVNRRAFERMERQSI